ncbi:MAG TPA: OmpA family protein [Burkholderiales bacterium]|nr:OmpA family protein [Burkholderiales bacterium]
MIKQIVLAAGLAGLAGAAAADNGYVTNAAGGGSVTNPYGLCWRSGDWTPDKAAEPCDAVPRPVAAAPVPTAPPPAPVAVAPAPAPAPLAPPRPVIEKLTLSSDVLFDFDKATLKDEGKRELDALASRIKDAKVDEIDAVGHADRIASEKYNQQLSERRAAAVKEYLASTGVPTDKIRAEGKGESEPVTGDSCRKMGKESGKNRKLVECLQPDRRVEIEVLGTREVAASSPSGTGSAGGASSTPSISNTGTGAGTAKPQ